MRRAQVFSDGREENKSVFVAVYTALCCCMLENREGVKVEKSTGVRIG